LLVFALRSELYRQSSSNALTTEYTEITEKGDEGDLLKFSSVFSVGFVVNGNNDGN
jgi:hypothetical protein